jgi:UDP-glucose 4-epimerase
MADGNGTAGRSGANGIAHAGSGRDRVVVTGISGRLGRLVAQRLHRGGEWDVVGIDRRPFRGRPKDVEHIQVDLRSKKARDVFRTEKVQALIHLGLMHDPRAGVEEHHSWNVGGTARLLDYCQSYGVPKVVVLSSADVYGPRPDNPQFLTEEAPLMAAQAFPGIRDLIAVDMLACSFFWKAQQCETVVLRPVHILGSVHNAASNYLRLPAVPTLLGFDPMLQVIHELDVVEALCRALSPGVRGIFNLAGPGEVPLSAILRELEKPVLRIPSSVARPLLGALFRAKMTSFPAPELDHIRFVCMVDGRRARETLGFRPHYSLKETIRAVLRDEA